jgi:hypothetical protein
MDVMNARVALRERGVLEVLDLMLLFVRTYARAYAWMALFVLVPSFAATWLVGESLGPGWGWTFAALSVAGAELPFTALASRLVFDDRARARDAFGQALRVAPLAVFASFVALAGVALGAMLVVLPGLWIAATTLYLPEAIVLEKGSFGAAFARSSRLCGSSFAEAAAGALLRFAMPLFAVIIADVAGRSILADLFELPPPPSLFQSGMSALALAGFWLCVPFVATARFLLYINCRTRTEGWDVQTKFAALALRAEQT